MKKVKPSFIIIVLSLCFSTLNAQLKDITSTIVIKEDSTQSVWQLAKHDVKYTLKSVGNSFTRPLHWKAKDYAKLGILLGGTAALTFADDPVRDLFQNNRDGFPKVVRDFGWYFGSPQNYFMANAGLYGFGLITKNEKVRKTSVLIISASITTGFIQTITKNAVGRARPATGVGNLEFSPYANDSRFRAFPSGHTILSVTMAHAIAKQFDNIWAKIGIYSIGAIPPISRLVDDAHWITDIVFSTAVSIFVVDGIDKFLFKEKAYDYPREKKLVSWNLRFGTNQIGLVGSF